MSNTSLLLLLWPTELEYFDHELVAEHTRQLHERFANGDLGSSFYYGQLRNIRSMMEYDKTGKISWSNPTQGSKYKLAV